MKLIVNHTIEKDGGVSFSVESERRRECHAYIGPKDDAYEWACGLMAVYVKGLLMDAKPKAKPTRKKKGSE